jgi:TRAP-type C4-dicarboxylate transport system permease small subunit
MRFVARAAASSAAWVAPKAAALSRAGAVVGAAALALMIILITAQVVSRRLMASPMSIADELSGWLLTIATFSALGYTLLHDEHIRVTLLVELLHPRVSAWLAVGAALLGAMLSGLLMLRTGSMAWDSFVGGTFSIAGSGWLLWPAQSFMPIGFAVLLVQMFAVLVRDLNRAISGPNQ